MTALHCGYGPAPLARVFTASLDQVGDGDAVLLQRPSKDGFARLDGRLGKIARLTPVFL